MLARRKKLEADELELLRMYQSMHNTMEVLRTMDEKDGLGRGKETGERIFGKKHLSRFTRSLHLAIPTYLYLLPSNLAEDAQRTSYMNYIFSNRESLQCDEFAGYLPPTPLEFP